MSDPAYFDEVVATLRACYPVDARRVYAVGHSLGAITCTALAESRRDALAAVACLSGGGVAPNGPPLLLWTGTRDRMFPPARFERLVADAARRGLPVELRIAKDVGHTLLPGEVLPETIAWLLERERGR
jgi:predicted esterase